MLAVHVVLVLVCCSALAYAWPTKAPKTTPKPAEVAADPLPVDPPARPPVAPVVPESPSAPAAAPPAGTDGGPLNICTWNVFRFGPKKFADTEEFVTKYHKSKIDMMVEQMGHADILALQEYFDPSLEVLNTLRDALSAHTGSKWNYSVSARVGRVSQEQYVFLYRTEVASVVKDQVYPEPANTDPYSREPFFTHFKVKKGKTMKEMVLGTIHTEPSHAVEEMNALVDTIGWAEKFFTIKDVMVIGDYNADCQYVRKSAWDSVKLWTDKAFKWFIPHGTDTASMASECTFDRAISRSQNFNSSFVPGSMKVLDFVAQYGIKVSEARQLSDHFPVCLQFN